MSKLSRLSHIGVAKETVMGTPVVPSTFLAVTSFDEEDVIAEIRDESVRANSAMLQGLHGGHIESRHGFGGHIYPDTIGTLLAMLGLTDTTSAGTGSRTIHTMKASSSQPPTYTITDYDAVEARAYPGSMLDELSMSVDVKGAAEFDASFVGWASADTATPVPSFSTVDPFLGWQLTWSAGGVASTRVQTCEMTFARGAEVIHGSDGTQGARETFADGLLFTASAKLLFEDTTDFDRFLAYAENALAVTLTQPGASGGVLVVNSAAAVWKRANRDRSGKYVTLDCEIEGVFNTTDAGPAHVVLTNSVATSYSA